jgi:hypothetical protein
MRRGSPPFGKPAWFKTEWVGGLNAVTMGVEGGVNLQSICNEITGYRISSCELLCIAVQPRRDDSLCRGSVTRI